MRYGAVDPYNEAAGNVMTERSYCGTPSEIKRYVEEVAVSSILHIAFVALGEVPPILCPPFPSEPSAQQVSIIRASKQQPPRSRSRMIAHRFQHLNRC